MVKAIVGANWGDEGKGKITDMLAQQSDVVIRFQGGANAGHTIINPYGRFALHILPSGIFYPHVTNVIGNGVALDIQKLSDELSGAHYMLDTLRFFNHEFMNKLHVILGYLQTGETEKAASFIINSSLVSSQAIRETADCIRVSRICALVIGKMMHAAELGIRLAVAPDSYCRQEDLLLPEEDYVTIVGNLLENAVEELSRGEHDLKEIRLALYCRPDCNVIVCEDTGGGVDPEIQPHIFEKGVSSKGEGRGLGLCLIHQLVEQYHGTIDVMTEAGAGTCFTLTFTDSVPEEA